MKEIIGYIYKITSPSNKIYIGQTTNIEQRKKKYKYLSCKTQTILYNSIKKYGWDKHLFEIIEECKYDDKKSILNEREIFWIKELNSFGPDGMNCTLGGNGTLGRKKTEEEKNKISQAQIGKKIPLETVERQRKTLIEGYASGRIINHNKGKKMSDEQKDKLSKNTNFRNLSQESINKRTKTNTGKRRSGKIDMINRYTNELIMTFNGLTDIDLYFKKEMSPNIKAFLSGRLKQTHSYGYIWKYTKEQIDQEIITIFVINKDIK